MIRRPPRLTRTYTPVPYPKLFRSPHKNTAHPFPGHAASGRKVRRYRSQLEAHPRHDHAAEMVVLVIAVREIIDPAIAVIVGQVGAIERQFDMLRSEEHTSELQSLMRISYAVFCLKKKKN